MVNETLEYWKIIVMFAEETRNGDSQSLTNQPRRICHYLMMMMTILIENSLNICVQKGCSRTPCLKGLGLPGPF